MLELPKLPEIENLTTQEQAYLRLRHAIMIGSFGPGAALTIRGLAKALDMSPTPVREALRQLTAQQGLSILDNRRVITPAMDISRFDALIKLRIQLETHASEGALDYINGRLIEKLVSIDQRIDAAVNKLNYAEAVILNQRFHTLIYTANPDQVVMPMIESVWLQLGPFTRLALEKLDTYYLIDRHKEALDALRKHDKSALIAAIKSDITDGMGHLGIKSFQ